MRENDGWTVKYGHLVRFYGRQEHERWLAEKSKNKTKQIRLLEEQKARLKEQLAIATKALEDIGFSLWDEMDCRYCAKKALKAIKKWGVK